MIAQSLFLYIGHLADQGFLSGFIGQLKLSYKSLDKEIVVEEKETDFDELAEWRRYGLRWGVDSCMTAKKVTSALRRH